LVRPPDEGSRPEPAVDLAHPIALTFRLASFQPAPSRLVGRKRDAMASEMVTVKVGDILMRGDDEWRVTDIGTDENGESVVTLGSVDEGATELGASGAGIPGIQLPEHA
jgi:hypothetical protein